MIYENIIYITAEESKNHSYYHCEVDKLLTIIDTDHLFDFITNLDSWAPDCYWKGKLIQGELMWEVYSYLITTQLMIIENEYWVELPSFGNHPNKYNEPNGYYNPLEDILYLPILNQLVKEGFYQKVDDWQYILGLKPLRDRKLKELGI